MSFYCPKCNGLIEPNSEGSCPLCGAQAVNASVQEPFDHEIEQITTLSGYKTDKEALLKRRLWNPIGFIIISMLCSFLPASILYALNSGRAGSSKRRTIALAAAPVLFVAAVMSSLYIPGSIIKTLFYGLNIGAAVFMYNDQKDLYKQYTAAGGKGASYIIPVVGCAVFTGVLIFGMIYSINIPSTYMTFQGDELYYTSNIEKTDVEKLGNYLVNTGLFIKDDKTVSFKIDKNEDSYVLSVIIDKERYDDPQVMSEAQLLSQSISRDVYNGAHVEVDFCNGAFKVQKVAVN